MFAWIACFLLLLPPVYAQDLSSLDPKVQTFLKTYKSERLSYNTLFNHYYQSPVSADTAIVFLPGMGEPALKYYDLATDIKGNATLYFWDHIGQGESSHLVPEEMQKVHIDSFKTHVESFTAFLQNIRKSHKKIILIGHSMGAHVALRAVIAHPELAEGLVMSAPLMEINSTWVPVHLISWLANFVPSTYYPPFYSLFKRNSERGNYTTTSKERVAIYKQTYTLFPNIKRSGATLGWIRAAQESISELRAADLSKVELPMLLLQAEQEYLVSNPAQTATCKRIASCELKIVTGSRHELLFETDKPRSQALQWINEFIQKNGLALSHAGNAQ